MSSSTPTKVVRRKLRRGTASCWECKRRKTRCHFEQSSSSACVSCKRRGCKCVLQHIEDGYLVTEAVNQPNLKPDVEEQINHLEGLVDRLVRQSTAAAATTTAAATTAAATTAAAAATAAATTAAATTAATTTSTSIRDSETFLPEKTPFRYIQDNASANDAASGNDKVQQRQQSQTSSNPRRKILPKVDKSPSESFVSSLDHRSTSSLENRFPSLNPLVHKPCKGIAAGPSPSLFPPDPTTGSPRCSSLALMLQSILPSVSITARIMHHNKPLMMSMHVFQGLSADPFRPPPPRQAARLTSPIPNPKPIELARSLFQLAICLQQSDRTSEVSELCLERSNSDVAGQYFEAASRYVTSQDSLVASSEGIETLMLEGLYHVSTGQPRSAWLVFRRALGIAHLMGLHIPQRRRHDKQDKQDKATNRQTSACLATLWFRLVFMDRYLSMVLCLPISVRDDSFVQDLVPQEPHEKLERIHAVLTSRIVSRNEILQHGQLIEELTYNHYSETKDIDYELKKATRSLSADWWAFPRLKDAHTNAELKAMTAKVVLQLHHYNLVLLLHLPYVLPRVGSFPAEGTVPNYTNSKISAMFASRELLTRSIIPIGPSRASSSTRGNTLKILLSALALLLSHLDSHRLGRENIFDHQRPGDLLMVERAIDSLDAVSHKYDDSLCYSATRALNRLRAVEASAADGVEFMAWSQPRAVIEMECMVREEEADGVEMMFPYVGTIHIVRKDSQKAASTTVIGSHPIAENRNLDDSILTPAWSLSDSPLSLLPEDFITASSIDNSQDAFKSVLSSTGCMKDTWSLQSGNLECVEGLQAPRRYLQDFDFTGGI